MTLLRWLRRRRVKRVAKHTNGEEAAAARRDAERKLAVTRVESAEVRRVADTWRTVRRRNDLARVIDYALRGRPR